MISREEFVERFASLSSDLSHPEIDRLLGVLERRELAEGEVLFEDGAPSTCAYLVEQGSFRAVIGANGATSEAGRIEAGSWVGEGSLLDGGPAAAAVIAATPAVVLGLSAAALEQLRQADPRVAIKVGRALCVTVAGRLRTATDHLEALRGGSAAPTPLPRRGLIEALRALMGARS